MIFFKKTTNRNFNSIVSLKDENWRLEERIKTLEKLVLCERGLHEFKIYNYSTPGYKTPYLLCQKCSHIPDIFKNPTE
jgi:hypothetical protein